MSGIQYLDYPHYNFDFNGLNNISISSALFHRLLSKAYNVGVTNRRHQHIHRI